CCMLYGPQNGVGANAQSAKVAGLDFSQGVIIEGELKKKRANLVVKWRKKYYVLSKLYNAMFFWSGTKNTVEGVIKKVCVLRFPRCCCTFRLAQGGCGCFRWS
ncbi:MAG: PH domain-containing protein, partial [bacterium]